MLKSVGVDENDEKNYDVNDDACQSVGVDENDEKTYDENGDACEAVLKS